jgi:hypothetical protein
VLSIEPLRRSGWVDCISRQNSDRVGTMVPVGKNDLRRRFFGDDTSSFALTLFLYTISAPVCAENKVAS